MIYKKENRQGLLLACVLSLCSASAQATLSFDQLNWFGLSTNTPDSEWGRVNMNFIGSGTTQYFNLNVNGNWVIQNMGVDSLFGAGVSQDVSKTFDLGVPSGTDVTSLNYAESLTSSPLSVMPVGSTPAAVNDLDYQIGGEDSVDLGTPVPGAVEAGGIIAGLGSVLAATVTSSAKLPNIDKVDNQVQVLNECAAGAISNSLKYLQATGTPKLGAGVATDIADIRTIIGTTASGTNSDWPEVKANHFAGVVDTVNLGANDIAGLIAAVNAGKDVELDLLGHVAMIVGVRVYGDGRVELDIFDDNQKDAIKDKMRTVKIVDGKVGGKLVEKFVVESTKNLTANVNQAPLLGIPAFIAMLIGIFASGFIAMSRTMRRR